MSNKNNTKARKPVSHQKTPPKGAHASKPKTIWESKPYLIWAIPLAVVVIAVIVVAATLMQGQKPAAADTIPANISVDEAQQRFSEGAFMLDVRTTEEWNESHVEGAVLIPLSELETRISEIPTDQDVLIICRSGNRSSQARDILRGKGLMRTSSIMGGINAWSSNGLPVVTGP